MATGRLGIADLTASAGAYTELYTCPASNFSVLSVSLCNRTTGPALIRIALSSTTSPSNSEFIEYDVNVAANQVLERTGIVMDAGKKIMVRSSVSNVSAVAYGIETTTV